MMRGWWMPWGAVLSLLAVATQGDAATYKCRAASGGLEYRDTPCADEAELLDKLAEPTPGYRASADKDDDEDMAGPVSDGVDADGADPDGAARGAATSASADTAEIRTPDALVGSYDEVDGTESLTVSDDGRVLIEDGARRVRGSWESVGDDAYRMVATIYGRALDCDAALDGARLSLDCPGDASVYERR